MGRGDVREAALLTGEKSDDAFGKGCRTNPYGLEACHCSSIWSVAYSLTH